MMRRDRSCASRRNFLILQDDSWHTQAESARHPDFIRSAPTLPKHEYNAAVAGAVPRKLITPNRAREVAVYNGMCNAQSAIRELASQILAPQNEKNNKQDKQITTKWPEIRAEKCLVDNMISTKTSKREDK